MRPALKLVFYLGPHSTKIIQRHAGPSGIMIELLGMASARKLRILIVSYDFPARLGGVATCAQNLAGALASLPNAEVRVIAPCWPGSAEFDRQQSFQVVRVPLSLRPAVAVLAFMPAILWQTLWWRPQSTINLLWFPDGVATYSATRWLGPLRTPYYLFSHGVEVLESLRNWRKRLRAALGPVKRAVFRSAEGVFSVSEFTKGIVTRNCAVEPDKIRVVHNGVNCAEFYPREVSAPWLKELRTAGRFIFLTMCRIEDYKGVDQVIRAADLLRAEHPEFLYLVAGTGKDLPRLRELVRERGLESHVRFLGKVPQEDMLDLYNLADCFLMACRADWAAPNVEGFGIVFLEAAACSKPVIAGASGGTSDAVAHGESGLLVDPLDPRSIRDGMKLMLREDGLAAELGRRGRRRAETQFTWGHAAAKIQESIRANVRN